MNAVFNDFDRRTVYQSIRDVNKELVGLEVIDYAGPVLVIDEEGELRGVFKPNGYPGVCVRLLDPPVLPGFVASQLWFAAGDLHHARTYSKPLVGGHCCVLPLPNAAADGNG